MASPISPNQPLTPPPAPLADSIAARKEVLKKLYDGNFSEALVGTRFIKDANVRVLAFGDIVAELKNAAPFANSSIESIVASRLLLVTSTEIKHGKIPADDRARLLKDIKDIRGTVPISVADEVALNNRGVNEADYTIVEKVLLLKSRGKLDEAKALADKYNLINTASRVGAYCSLARLYSIAAAGTPETIRSTVDPVKMFQTAIGWAADAKEAPKFYKDEISRLIKDSALSENDKKALLDLLNEKVS